MLSFGLFPMVKVLVSILVVVLTGFVTEILHYARLEPHRHIAYFVHLTCERKLARPTVTIALCGIKFFYTTTLGRDWSLFSKKTAFACPSRCVFPRPSPTARFAGCSRTSSTSSFAR